MDNQVNINVCGVQGAPYTYKTVVLKPNVVGGKNILTQLMMGQTNTKYVIKYDYVIDPDIQTGIASVSESNISHCVNPNYAAALAAYNLAHDAWIDADNAYTNNPNDTTLAAKNAAYAAYTAAQTTLNNTPQFYYYAANAIIVKQGQHINIPNGCVLLNASLSGITDFVVAHADTTVYIGSLTAGEYNYTVQNAIVIPSGCLIEFDGGSISDGVLIGDETILIFDQEEEVILKNVELLGEFEYSAGGSGGVDKKDNVDGMATITLKKNKSFASQLTQPNTIYRIIYDFDLGNERVTISENCVLEFDGGSLSNGTIVGNNTTIDAEATKIFDTDITLAGTWNVKEGYPEWFGCFPNDDTIDTTPAIQKLVAVAIPVVFGDGTWYLSECLLQGDKNVNIKGTGNSYKVGTILRAFNATGQRFIMKLGGLADFSKPSDYYAVWCSNFVLDGIRFNTYDTVLNNEEPPYEGQCYAAVCFDWCVEGYVNIRHGGACPAVFIANTWETYFESIVCYGSYTQFNESAIYFGKCYTDVVSSNISAITINNLFGESIYGKFVDTYYVNSGDKANIADLIINNVEFEPQHGINPSDYSFISKRNEQAISVIDSNIRTMDVQYYFNFACSYTLIHSIVYGGKAETYDNDAIVRGLISSSAYSGHLIVGKIINLASYGAIICGASNAAKLTVNKIECDTYTGAACVFTKTNPITDMADVLQNITYTGEVHIEESNAVIDKDLIKTYDSGVIFNSKSIGNVCTLRAANNNAVQIVGSIEDDDVSLIRFNNYTLYRKFKFNGSNLIIRYTVPNKWDTENIIFTYYKDESIVHTDNVKLDYSDTKLLSYKYAVYADDYDYCTIRFKSVVCIESISVGVGEKKSSVSDDVVSFGSEISSDVLTIMSHYVRDDAYKRTALQCFFNKIGVIKNKLNHIILPIFANNINEAIYDVVNDAPFYNIDGGNYLVFNKHTRRLHISALVDGTTVTWRSVSYSMYDPNDFQGCLTIMSATDPVGGDSAQFKGVMLYGINTRINTSSAGFFTPNTTDNVKIIGGGIVSVDGVRNYMRLGDTPNSDKCTAVGDTLYNDWDYRCQIFGQKPDDNTKGIRILVSTGELITADEAKILRDAVVELDDKFAALDEVNDNYTPAVEKLLIPNSGTWNDKPSSADISVGFAYFCTDKQTEEGAADGIMIYYKGQDTTDPDNPVDIWVDALGRVVS